MKNVFLDVMSIILTRDASSCAAAAAALASAAFVGVLAAGVFLVVVFGAALATLGGGDPVFSVEETAAALRLGGMFDMLLC